MIAELLGIPAEDRNQFREWSDAFVSLPGSGDNQKFYQSASGFVGYLRKIFDLRRKNPQQDMITALLQAEEAGDRLSTEELFSMVVLLIIAGHETTVTLIGNAVVTMLTHPDVLERLKQHPEDMPKAIEEFLRYASPVYRSVTRWATEDVILGDRKINRGDMVIAILGSANRDETHYVQASELDIDRDNRDQMAFGRGIHYCLGAPLARLEAEIALNTLLKRMPNLRLATSLDSLVYRETPLFLAYEHIPVSF